MAGGSQAIANGSTQLQTGANTLADGSHTAAAGATSLASGLSELESGAGELATGLADGRRCTLAAGMSYRVGGDAEDLLPMRRDSVALRILPITLLGCLQCAEGFAQDRGIAAQRIAQDADDLGALRLGEGLRDGAAGLTATQRSDGCSHGCQDDPKLRQGEAAATGLLPVSWTVS